jgi:hypothetical protein
MLLDRPFTRAFTGDLRPQAVSAYRDQCPIVPSVGGPDDAAMKRIAAAPLWFLVGWYLGSAASWILGVGPLLAPVMAVALTGLVIADPRQIIWDRHETSRRNF